MTTLQKIYTALVSLLITIALFAIVLKPVLVAKYIDYSKRHARGQYICTLNSKGEHIGELYKIKSNKKILENTTTSDSCVFKRPTDNLGFFIFAVGGGGGATPYESGNAGQIISKYKIFNNPQIQILIGKGGNGTILKNNRQFVDAQNGTKTVIKTLNIIANGGSCSNRMTPLGIEPKTENYHISEKYHYLYDIPKSAKYGAGGQYTKYKKELRPNAENGYSGAVIILW